MICRWCRCADRAGHSGRLQSDDGLDEASGMTSRRAPRVRLLLNRSGIVLGEGAWLYVLEEFEHAKERGAKIYAEITGYGATCDAYHRVRLEESGDEPARAMRSL